MISVRLKKILKNESAGGMVMIGFALIAMVLANSALSTHYKYFLQYEILGFPVKEFVKDVLMPVFFFVIGMELKKEMLEGFLSQKGQKMLPLIAAVGGIVTPALIYLFINHAYPQNHAGWAIPTATDIAFALCALSLIGRAVPPAAKVFLLAIAIYDDLAAIVIIALFYSGALAITPILFALLIIALLLFVNRRNLYSPPLFLVAGVALWFCFHHSGIHTTVAGVIIGVLIPLKNKKRTPLNDVLHSVHPYSTFVVLPLFALVSAGISFAGINMEALLAPLTLGITAALFFGKQIGIFLFTYAAVRLGIASRPAGAGWVSIYAVSILAGIGFTMSLFVGLLAFSDPLLQEEVKTGVIIGSVLSVIWGAAVIKLIKK